MSLPDPLPDVVPSDPPCQPWTTREAVRERCGATPTEISDAALDYGVAFASKIMWAGSGRRYGLCLRTVRPCYTGCIDPLVCSCWLPSLRLPGPIAFVDSVWVDGVQLDNANFQIRTDRNGQRRELVRVDGEAWPCCQALIEDPTVVPAEPLACPAWSVSYWQGRPIPAEAVELAGALAEQLARHFCNAPGCDPGLEAGLRRISRRGVTREYDEASLSDPDSGQVRTGLQAVDRWLATVNPHRKTRPSAIVRAYDSHRTLVRHDPTVLGTRLPAGNYDPLSHWELIDSA